MIFGYNTNGFVYHRLEDTIDILSEIGYEAVGITLDHAILNPYDDDIESKRDKIRRRLEKRGMRSVIETGNRYLLDPRRRHQPTMISPTEEERHHRVEFLCRSIETSASLGSAGISFWSGKPIDEASDEAIWERLEESMEAVIACAEKYQVRLLMESEPGMWAGTMQQVETVIKHFDHPLLGATLDIGHVFCQQEEPLPGLIRRVKDKLWNVHFEDMKAGIHDHLPPGEGEMDLVGILDTLDEVGYNEGVYVELSRHSGEAIEIAQRTWRFLDDWQVSKRP